MTRISSYISFPGNAAEVLTYYRDVFGGTLDMLTYGQANMGDMGEFQPPAEAVAHALLDGGMLRLTGGDDVLGGGASLESGTYSFLIEPETTAVAQDLIDRLTTDGGEVTMPFEKAPWGDHYGQVKDRYGVLWQVNVTEGSAG
ncbi:VOC family protein [Brachybacterium sp. EF45031]|uniref:VOC family protein n=1 Tax=Brachybacterium sillae TaxID=2810536 RepID=UPI00217F1D62|nr:VOC family protein [Brachybacterium sillae]MCS6711912.1 VOC family protein [Brachybacterium sillae]